MSRKKGRPLTCFISTFGCQMNARDSEKLLGILLDAILSREGRAVGFCPLQHLYGAGERQP